MLLNIALPGSDPSDSDWVIIELQGQLIPREKEYGLDGKTLGHFFFTKQGQPTLIIGHHILNGKLENLEKPFLVLRKSTEADKDDTSHNYYDVKATVTKRIIFSKMPKPIVACVPKRT